MFQITAVLPIPNAFRFEAVAADGVFVWIDFSLGGNVADSSLAFGDKQHRLIEVCKLHAKKFQSTADLFKPWRDVRVLCRGKCRCCGLKLEQWCKSGLPADLACMDCLEDEDRKANGWTPENSRD